MQGWNTDDCSSISSSTSHLHPPPFILSSHTLHSVCSTDFLPPVSLPPFSPLLISAFSRCSCTPSTQMLLPPLLSFSISQSDLALPLPLLSLSLTGYIIQLHSSSFLFFLFPPFVPSNASSHLAFSIPAASCLSPLLCVSDFSRLASASCLPPSVCLLSHFRVSFFLSVLWALVN